MHASRKTLIYVTCFHVVILVIWLYSGTGARSHLTILHKNETVSISFGGKQIVELKDSHDFSGKIGINFLGTGNPPLCYAPQAVDNVIVSDPETGRVLFEDTFDGGMHNWGVFRGKCSVTSDSRLSTPGSGTLITRKSFPADYRLDMDIYNGANLDVYCGYKNPNQYFLFNFTIWRELVMGVFRVTNGNRVFLQGHSLVENPAESLKVILARFIRSYAAGLLVLILSIIFYYLICLIVSLFLRKRNKVEA